MKTQTIFGLPAFLACVFLIYGGIILAGCTKSNPIEPDLTPRIVVDSFKVSISVKQNPYLGLFPSADYTLLFLFQNASGKVNRFAVYFQKSGLWAINDSADFISPNTLTRWQWDFWAGDSLVGVDTVKVYGELSGTLWDNSSGTPKFLKDFAWRDSLIVHIQR
jgi:hypothetical protein